MKPEMQKIATKNRVKTFLEKTYKRNKDTVITAKKNDSTKQVIKHADQMIKNANAGVILNHDALFDFGKKKTKVPLDSFTEYYAYKTEEMENNKRVQRKLLLEASNGGLGEDEDGLEEEKIILSPSAIFSKYISENYFNKPDVYISEEQYLQLDFMNQIPEVVCDILCYLAKYHHYRTKLISYETYEVLMDAQMQSKSVATLQQKRSIEEEGWKYSERGIEHEVEKLNLENYRKQMMSHPSHKITIEATYNVLKRVQGRGESLTVGEKKLMKDFESAEAREGRYIYDYGQRMFKWNGPKKKDKVKKQVTIADEE